MDAIEQVVEKIVKLIFQSVSNEYDVISKRNLVLFQVICDCTARGLLMVANFVDRVCDLLRK